MISSIIDRLDSAIAANQGISLTVDELIYLRQQLDEHAKQLAHIVLRDLHTELKEIYLETIPVSARGTFSTGVMSAMLAERAETLVKSKTPFKDFSYFNKNPVPLRKA